MLLSEAIRLGAMLGPQLRYKLFDHRRPGASCAMGSVLLAIGVCDGSKDSEKGFFEEFDGQFPGVYDGTGGCVWSQIVYRNNEILESREQIADWLVESGNDCESVAVPIQQEALSLDLPQMVSK